MPTSSDRRKRTRGGAKDRKRKEQRQAEAPITAFRVRPQGPSSKAAPAFPRARPSAGPFFGHNARAPGFFNRNTAKTDPPTVPTSPDDEMETMDAPTVAVPIGASPSAPSAAVSRWMQAASSQRQEPREPELPEPELSEAAAPLSEQVDAAYFEAYDQLEVHALMLSDSQRLGSYLAAIRAHHLQGKRVLDVGAGSGILSMLAAKHGQAEHVWAVEAVPGMAKVAKHLVEQNGLQDKVTVLNSRVEDVQLPGKVDVIISEWMGFYLLHESMLESVLIARDRFLHPQGLMLPSSARIWAALVECEDFRKEMASYEDFLGLDLSFMAEQKLMAKISSEPEIEEVNPRRLLAEPILAWDLGDLHRLPVEGTRELQAQLCFRTWRKGHVAAIAFWFDVGFGHEVILKTDPGSPPTHWKQTVVYLGTFPEIEAGDVLEAAVTMQQSEENSRQYKISIETI